MPRNKPKAQQPAASIRGRRQRKQRLAPGNPHNRIKIVLIVLMVMLAGAAIKLTFIQGWNSAAYAAKAEDQRTRNVSLVADRGAILDRNGTQLAFSVQGRQLAVRPALFTGNQKLGLSADGQKQKVADILVAALGTAVNRTDLLAGLDSEKTYVYLVRGVMPEQSDAIMAQITAVLDPKVKFSDSMTQLDAVVTERQDLREYPDGALARSVVGATSTWDGNHGTMGIEAKFDALLAGTSGSRVVDVYGGGVIPGSSRDEVAAVNGADLTLTLDSDLQFTVSQMLQSYVDQHSAKRGMAIVEDVKTGQIYAISDYTAGQDPSTVVSNMTVNIPFEPGSVNKIVTMAAALEAGITTPTTVYPIDGSIAMGGRTVHDAWPHGTIEMTTTGILAKSSNVGTLTIAQKVGPDLFATELQKFGLGQKTGIELPGESAGQLMDKSQWSATTFANLPIGQGLGVTLVQMAAMYQAIGNKGVRLPPTLVAGTTTGGAFTASSVGAGTPVMSPSTADTLLGMLRGTTQSGDIGHKGTAPGAAINGYQVAGKTGTAQQIDPHCKCYSDSMYNSTFAGLVPADNPRFVIAIMLDAPQGGTNAVPLFHDIAAYSMRSFDVPPSSGPAPIYDLYVNY